MKDKMGIILGGAVVVAAVTAAIVFLWGMGDILRHAMDSAPPWLSLAALFALLLDGFILFAAVKKVAGHRLPPEPFLEKVTPAIRTGRLDEVLQLCKATGPRGIASLLAAWVEAVNMDDLGRKQQVAKAALKAARGLEKDAKAARIYAGLGAFTGISVALGGVVWSHSSSLNSASALHPFLVTLLGVILLVPSLATMTFIASSVSKSASELQSALPAITGIESEKTT
ncbi:MAG: hypothetical protein GXP49_11815 [Deltaproteobacteria bacterium]|nr:hypothetical protein [Deltaproteobacteria bacterium]